ncbi:VWA domain-containing protein [Thiomicrorhabdus sp. zzn3]|uniref:VWA domain-containing protein n=1 Tax=Thiomicrorhabdus sp. zzn3 TaxID=3039775 RepID=UPI0024369E33|nr:VWA domain-containing protein [Thiomicrorhabdus sp. zzn3]MDG6778793.1 VWA domain-containing protein [Thiomicrorhabdus sp. zzn3]
MSIHIEFLRPWWFLGLIPVAWLLWKAWWIQSNQGAWQNVIEPKFHKLLLGQSSDNQGMSAYRLALAGLAAIWIMAVVALAGPSLKSVKLPAQKTQQGTVIVFDLSLSMLADDLKPNRLSRARFKLIDLLKAHPETAFGMVAYAGSAHTIAPISEDNQTLLALIPTLDPLMMPSYGSNPVKAMEMADSLFKGANITHGHIIWMTDDLETEQQTDMIKWFAKHDYHLSILAVGTREGGSVPVPNYGLLKDSNGAIVLPKLPYERLEALSRQTGAALTPLTLDDSDLQRVLPSFLGGMQAVDDQAQAEKEVLYRLDDGTAIILAMLPLVALAYRRGWLFSLAAFSLLPATALTMSVLAMSALYAPPSYAEAKFSDLADVFQTPDQQGYKAWKKQDYDAAESLFESPAWKGATLYKNGKYKEAAEQFKRDRTARGHYNLGNALAQLGQYQGAQQAYEKALQMQPDFTAAQHNLELIKQLQKNQQASNQNANSDNAMNQHGQQENAQNASQNPHSNGSQAADSEASRTEQNQQASPQTDQKSGQKTDAQQNTNSKPENASGQPTQNQAEEHAQESDLAAKDSASEQTAKRLSETKTAKETESPEQLSEQQLATENWLKQIPDQPGLFLKRKFDYQYRNASPENTPDSIDSTQSSQKKIW